MKTRTFFVFSILIVLLLRCASRSPLVEESAGVATIEFIDGIYRAAESDDPEPVALNMSEMLSKMDDYCDAGFVLPVYQNIDQLVVDADRAAALDSMIVYSKIKQDSFEHAIVGGEFLCRFLVAAQHRLHTLFDADKNNSTKHTAVSADGHYVFHFQQNVTEMLPTMQLHEKYAAVRTRILTELVGLYPILDDVLTRERYWIALDRILDEIILNRSETNHLMFQRRADGLLLRPSEIVAELQKYSTNEPDAAVKEYAKGVVEAAAKGLETPLSTDDQSLISIVDLNRKFMKQRISDDKREVHTIMERREKWFNLAYQAMTPEQKIEYYTRAIKLDSSHAPAFNNRGNAQQSLDNFDDAMKDYDRAIALDSTFAIAHKNRGALYYLRDDFQAALNDFNRAVELDPTCSPCYMDRGKTLLKLERFDEALSDFDLARQFDPDNATILSYRGMCRQNLGDIEAAIQDYNNALQLEPNNGAALFNRASANRQSGRDNEAIKDYSRVLELQPDYTLALNNRAICYKNIGDFDLAIQDHLTALQKNPDDAVAYYNLGCVYWEQKNWSAVIDAWESCLRLKPDHAKAREWLDLAKNEQMKRR